MSSAGNYRRINCQDNTGAQMKTQPTNFYDIVGIGSACVDLLYRVDDKFLIDMSIAKGDGKSVSWDIFSSVLQACADLDYACVMATGGTSANTIKGLASLGHATAFYGKIGHDELGIFFRDKIKHLGIHSLLSVGSIPTSQIAVFVTPDHQRSFLSYSGANHLMTEAELDPALLENVRLLHVEGYMLDELHIPYVESVMQLAKSLGAAISMDMGCPRIAKTYQTDILRLLKTYADIVFANQDEAHALTDLPPQQACESLASICPTAVVGIGKDGCWASNGKELIQSPGIKAEAIDSTGAGDLFACGFIHGYLKDYALKDCAWLGNLLGSTAVTSLGAEIPPAKWPGLKAQINKTLSQYASQAK